jgi:UDP-2-acetamido-2,6-beta-L-arabino-hexul-4-ose reductase
MKFKILIFGATGFIGSSLSNILSLEYDILAAKINEDPYVLESKIKEASIVIHAAGVSRSNNEDDFFRFNMHYSTILFDLVAKYENKTIVYFSSIHYYHDNLYGISKRYNEYLINQAKITGKNRVLCYRTPGVYGIGSRHDYVSVVSTFCYRIANNLPVTVTDPSKSLQLIWIEDLIAIIKEDINLTFQSGIKLIEPQTDQISVGDLYDLISKFNANILKQYNANKDDNFENKILNTFLHFKKNML